MVITIVCVCGQHNEVRDEDLDCVWCVSCGTPLLQPAVVAGPRAPRVSIAS